MGGAPSTAATPTTASGGGGRAPSAFNSDNSVVSGGELQLQAKWEPDWKGFKGLPKDDDSGDKYKDVTCGMVTSQKKILRGYFEIRAMVANISMSSAFWLIGVGGEIDIFEMIGRSNEDPSEWTAMPMDIECPDSDNKVHNLGYLTAASYHTYGLEWDCVYLRYYADGEVVRTLKKSEAWCFDKPECLVLTQESFKWDGLPTQAQMTSKSLSERTYHVDYWRTWQKAGGYDCKSAAEVSGGC